MLTPAASSAISTDARLISFDNPRMCSLCCISTNLYCIPSEVPRSRPRDKYLPSTTTLPESSRRSLALLPLEFFPSPPLSPLAHACPSRPDHCQFRCCCHSIR